MSLPRPPVLLLRLESLDKSSSNFTDQLYDLLCQQEHAQSAQDLKHDDLVGVIDYLDDVGSDIALPCSLLKPT